MMKWVDTFMWWFIGVVAWWGQLIGLMGTAIMIPAIIRAYTTDEEVAE